MHTNSILARVADVAAPLIREKGAFIVDVSLRGEKGGRVLELFIDADNDVTTDLCAEISRELSHTLDLDGLIAGRYYLVVSSPGVDRPLKYPRQYAKHIGKKLTVKRKLEGKLLVSEGELMGVADEHIELRGMDGSLMTLAYDEILDARVNAPW